MRLPTSEPLPRAHIRLPSHECNHHRLTWSLRVVLRASDRVAATAVRGTHVREGAASLGIGLSSPPIDGDGTLGFPPVALHHPHPPDPSAIETRLVRSGLMVVRCWARRGRGTGDGSRNFRIGPWFCVEGIFSLLGGHRGLGGLGRRVLGGRLANQVGRVDAERRLGIGRWNLFYFLRNRCTRVYRNRTNQRIVLEMLNRDIYRPIRGAVTCLRIGTSGIGEVLKNRAICSLLP